ncbi:hypothetical protein HN873_034279, partial [Arachis hypogaea]
MANVLLEKGIDLNAEDEEGFCSDVAEVLVKKGADVEARSKKAIVACVPTKVHIEGAGETEFKISPTEITDAMKAGLDQPIMPEPEIVALFVQSDTMLWLINQDEKHENKGKDESCEAAESERCSINVIGRVLGKGFVGYITSQGRTNSIDSNGFVFKNCNVFRNGSTFLGRPWRPYARVLLYNTNMTNIIQPA